MNAIDKIRLLFPLTKPADTDHYHAATRLEEVRSSVFIPTISPTVNALVAALRPKLGYKKDGSPMYAGGTDDKLHLLPPSSFDGPSWYANAVAHELTHWSGGYGRLGRMGKDGQPSWLNSLEECTAQLGAALLLERDGLLSKEVAEYTAGYVRAFATRGWVDKAHVPDMNLDMLEVMHDMFGTPSPYDKPNVLFDKAAEQALQSYHYLTSNL